MEYEVGLRLDLLEVAVQELQQKVFPEKYLKKDKKESE